MSINVSCYIEAKIDGVWHSIDSYVKVGDKFYINEVVSGMSQLYTAISWQACDTRMSYNDLSEELRSVHKDYEYTSWSYIDGSWFEKRNLELPEFCGYLPRKWVLDYYAGEIDEDAEFDDSDFLFLDDYKSLSDEEKKAYMYIEYTQPLGFRDHMRTIKRTMIDRMVSYNRNRWRDKEHKLESIWFDDVRLIIMKN